MYIYRYERHVKCAAGLTCNTKALVTNEKGKMRENRCDSGIAVRGSAIHIRYT